MNIQRACITTNYWSYKLYLFSILRFPLLIIIKKIESNYLHFVRRFWNQVLTCESEILRDLARLVLSDDARYFCLSNRFSNSMMVIRENEVRGFFRLGGVRFW